MDLFDSGILQSGDWRRHLAFPSAVNQVKNIVPSDSVLQFLEVGVWAGFSTASWIKALKSSGRKFHTTTVDNWQPGYSDEDFERSYHYIKMTELTENGEIESIFRANMKELLLKEQITILKGNSLELLGSLPSNFFHLISIDANHLYEYVLADLNQAERILHPDGVIVGDDLEAQFDEIEFLSTGKAEYVQDYELGISYHPGVTRAVWEKYGRVSSFLGLFMVDKNGLAPKGLRYPSNFSVRLARKPSSSLYQYLRLLPIVKELVDLLPLQRIKVRLESLKGQGTG